MKIDGTGDTQLLDPTKDALPVFSPNGSKVLYRHSSTPLNGNCTYGAAIDGAWQGYVYGSGSNNSDIYVANRDGSSAQVAFSAVAYDWAGTQTSVIPSSTPVYRMANWMSHERLFTTDWNEVQTIKDKGGWVYEGLSFNAVSNSSIPVYRMANWKTHERLFTTDANEKDTIKDKGGWVYENIAFYADTSGTAVYRMANWKTQERLFTTDANERDAIKDKGGWVYEGVAFYAQ
jgi:5'(3')-deoxyribonucleotidase